MRKPRLVAAVGAFAGGALFIYTLHVAGLAQVAAQIRQVGPGFAVVLLLSGIRLAARSQAWRLCSNAPERFSFGDAFRAFVIGDALGNLTPLGPLASETTKALLGGTHLPAAEAVSSVILENIFYSVSVAVMMATGTLAFVFGYKPAQDAMLATLAVLVVAVVGSFATWWLLQNRPRLVSRLLPYDAVRHAEDHILQFASAHGDRSTWILLLEFAFHASAVAEIYLLLRLLGVGSNRTLLVALILETVERAITIAFKFVPLRMGVDQAGSGLAARAIDVGAATGITIATVRTARNLCWAAVGLVLLAVSGETRRD
jgi:Lysylphosphatidylglycerol synthase TM region